MIMFVLHVELSYFLFVICFKKWSPRNLASDLVFCLDIYIMTSTKSVLDSLFNSVNFISVLSFSSLFIRNFIK